MKRVAVATMLVGAFAANGFAATGEQLFKQHCVACHPGGSNIIKPNKTLHKKDLDKNGVKGEAGIIKVMRHPGTGMTRFDAKAVPEKDAKAIADYVLKTFK